MQTMKLLPWEDILILDEAPEERTEQGVIIAAAGQYDEKKLPEKGIVVAIGKPSDPKKKLPIELKPGDMVFYERYTANRISDGGKNYNFIRFKYIMGAKRKEDL